MTENILSLEDIKFLEVLHAKFGLELLPCDEGGIKFNNEQEIIRGTANEPFDNMCYLNEISKKLKFRLNSNFQLNFSHGFNFNIERF